MKNTTCPTGKNSVNQSDSYIIKMFRDCKVNVCKISFYIIMLFIFIQLYNIYGILNSIPL